MSAGFAFRLAVDPSDGRKNDKYTVSRTGGRRLVLTKGYRAFRRDVVAETRKARGGRPTLFCPLVLTMSIVWSGGRRRGDVDACVSAVLDGLQHGGLYEDDAQIEELHVRIRRARPGETPCVWVRVIPAVAG